MASSTVSSTGRIAKTGVSATSMVRSSLLSVTVRLFSVSPSTALVLLLPAFTRRAVSVPSDTTRANAASGIDTFFLAFIVLIVLASLVAFSALSTLFAVLSLLCFFL